MNPRLLCVLLFERIAPAILLSGCAPVRQDGCIPCHPARRKSVTHRFCFIRFLHFPLAFVTEISIIKELHRPGLDTPPVFSAMPFCRFEI